MSARDDNPPADAAEPRRLLDDPAPHETDASAAWALGLLRGADPYRTPAGRKQRVQLRLGHAPRRRAPLVLRLAVAACVLLGGAAVVSAAMGHWPNWATRAYERVVGRPPVAPAPARVHAARHATAPRAPAVAPPVDVPWPEIPLEPMADAPAQRPVRAAAPMRAARTAPLPAPVASEDTSAVSAAMRALRVESNPARARKLLARYLADHPNGSLAEEALALSIEAALAHHDDDVAALANRYLRQYPRGSFQALARQALVAQHASDGDTHIQ
jgi:hypothetical protein